MSRQDDDEEVQDLYVREAALKGRLNDLLDNLLEMKEDFKQEIAAFDERNKKTQEKEEQLQGKLAELKAVRKRLKMEKQNLRMQRKLASDSARLQYQEKSERHLQEVEEVIQQIEARNSTSSLGFLVIMGMLVGSLAVFLLLVFVLHGEILDWFGVVSSFA